MANSGQQLAQAKPWLAQQLTQLGGGGHVVGVDVGQVAVGGKVGYALRVHATPTGIQWLKQFKLPGLLKTPYGKLYVAVLPAQQQQAQQPQQEGQQGDANDPYADWEVKHYGTEPGGPVRVFGTDIENAQVKVSGTAGVEPKPPGEDKEFRLKSGTFGTTFKQFEPAEED